MAGESGVLAHWQRLVFDAIAHTGAGIHGVRRHVGRLSVHVGLECGRPSARGEVTNETRKSRRRAVEVVESSTDTRRLGVFCTPQNSASAKYRSPLGDLEHSRWQRANTSALLQPDLCFRVVASTQPSKQALALLVLLEPTRQGQHGGSVEREAPSDGLSTR